MIPVKIECGCGQRYAFEVEPVSGHMPTAVKCPGCGADGTAAANAFIAQLGPAQAPAPAATAPTHIRLSASAAPAEGAVSPTERPPYKREIDRDRLTTEARAKIFWGDPPDQVTMFLMSQGFDHEEASELVAGMFKERVANLRGIGLRRVFIGAGMMCLPIVSYFFYMRAGILPIKIFFAKVAVGLWGFVMLVRGSIMLLAPRLGNEDLADEQDD